MNMKTLKIGRGSSNDVILDDMTVSSAHAIIEIQEDGQVFIKDLNSKNGTFVNNKLITSRVSIFANDSIRVGNSELNWVNLINKPDKPPKPVPSQVPIGSDEIMRKVTIGRSSDNNIVFSQKDISSSHAFLAKKKNGSIVLVDNGSSNGTYVNGHRITLHTLHKGDKVLLANKHNLDWEPIFESGKSTKWLKACIILAILTIVFIGGWYYFSGKSWNPEKIYSTYNKSEVLIITSFYYKANVGQHDFGMWVVEGEQCKKIENTSEAMFGTGTGFFISNDGKMITNKHVVNFWEYAPQQATIIKSHIQTLIKNLISTGKLDPIEFLPLVSEVHVTSELSFLGILPNDTHFTGINDVIQCSVMKISTNDIDLAIIQTNSKSLPASVSKIVDVNKSDINEISVGKKIYSIGFPEGLNMGNTNAGIEANNQSGEITQIRGDIEFGHNVAIRGGASGSPVFNEYGNLIGVMNAGFVHTQGYNMAIKAKYVVEFVNK